MRNRKSIQRTPTGFIFYRGPSMIDGKPIVAVAITKRSTNSKTGDVVQTYIMVDNGQSPIVNVRNLDDYSICGDCRHRRGTGGACYVNLGQGPRAVADGIVRGIYPQSLASARSASAKRVVRMGTYGDPMAVPYPAWLSLIARASDHTGYSHQWRNESIDAGHRHNIMQLCMASADSVQDRDDAKAKQYRTFRIRLESQPVEPGEFICPASAERGKRMTCADCARCDGAGPTADPVIIVHGSLAKRFQPSVTL